MQSQVLTVKQLNFYVKSLIESDPKLLNLCVSGEISNLNSHYQSGHIYFTLKDNDAAISCVMFRSYAARVKFDLSNGLKVLLKGKVSVYEKDGRYQFYAEEMFPAGMGDITLRFEQIKAKLEAEGLFDSDTKRPLPKIPRKIAVVTSPTGAAVQDIINILSRRWPLAQIVMCPVTVQGENAVGEMIDTLERVYKCGDIDVIIIGRGGGSIEDLWAFNSEELARKVYESPFPIISAVGHETDFTICDFVADLRAPTPSAAAELAVPDMAEISALLQKQKMHLKTLLESRYKFCLAKLERCSSSLYFKNPMETMVNRKGEEVDRLSDRLQFALRNRLKEAEFKLSKQAALLDSLSPLKTISRGFAAVKSEGKVVGSIKDIKENDLVEIGFADGEADCQVKSVRRRNING